MTTAEEKMSAVDDNSIAVNDYYVGESTDDLERTLVLAAADADARNADVQRVSVIKKTEKESDSDSIPNPNESTSVGESKPLGGTVKRKSDERGDGAVKLLRTNDGYAKVVATHYNALEEKGLDERSQSRIFYMRKFHNWIKSMLINEYLTKIKDGKRHNSPIRVHDMCCGKGGDLLKWKKGNISYLICSDIAEVSLEQCKQRYVYMKNHSQRERNSANLFPLESVAADCSRIRLLEKYKDASKKLDLVSCQFAFHYSFESHPQAECWMRNAAEYLEPGGYFIGTIPDANEIMSRIRKSNSNTFGNELFQVTVDFDVKEQPPLFGAKYNFHLDGRVDCPEFLVYFPAFVKLAKKYGLKLVRKESFYDFYERMKMEGRNLLSTMKSLESYPPYDGTTLVGNAPDDYTHAEDFLKKDENRRNACVGTLSKSEWAASSLYLTFAFEKVKNTSWTADGVPVYDI